MHLTKEMANLHTNSSDILVTLTLLTLKIQKRSSQYQSELLTKILQYR